MNYLDYYNKFWLEGSEEWMLPRLTMTRIEKHLIDRYIAKQDFKVLDFGCGEGIFCGYYLTKIIKQYRGIDISKEAVKKAQQKGLNVKQFNIDVEKMLPFADNYFDAAICSEVLEHLFDPEHVLKEIFRVLKPQGVLFTSVPNVAYCKERLRMLFGGFNPKGHPLICKIAPWRDPHIRFFTKKSFYQLLQIVGFLVKEFHGEEFTPCLEFGLPQKIIDSKVVKLIHKITGFLGDFYPTLFATKFIVIAEKK